MLKIIGEYGEQGAEGATFGIIPSIKRRLTGQISGMAGAYGNVGAVFYLQGNGEILSDDFAQLINMNTREVPCIRPGMFSGEKMQHIGILTDGTVVIVTRRDRVGPVFRYPIDFWGFLRTANKPKKLEPWRAPMRLISWNVNGLRACLSKGFWPSAPLRTRMSSVCRRRKCGRSRRSLSWRAITDLEQRRQGRIFRHGCFHPTGAAGGDIRLW